MSFIRRVQGRPAVRAGLLVFMALVLTACSRPPSSGLPAAVAVALEGLAEECRAAQGTPRVDDAVKHADLNGDAREDYVLFAGWLACDGAPGVFGDREKPLQVFVGEGSRAARFAFGQQAYDARLEYHGGKAVLWVTTVAGNCGRPPAASFAEEVFCDRAIAWTAPGQFEFAPVDTVRIVQ